MPKALQRRPPQLPLKALRHAPLNTAGITCRMAVAALLARDQPLSMTGFPGRPPETKAAAICGPRGMLRTAPPLLRELTARSLRQAREGLQPMPARGSPFRLSIPAF